MLPVDYSAIYPELNGYFIAPLLVSPPMCTIAELKNGTYTIADLEMMHQIMEIKDHARQVASPPTEPYE